MKRLIVALIALAGLFFAGCMPVDDSPATDDPQQLCAQAGGTWEEFPNSCVDSCRYNRNPEAISCAQMLTEGCNCGEDQCWDGTTCVPI